jgi:carboxymethylenebutenolidase
MNFRCSLGLLRCALVLAILLICIACGTAPPPVVVAPSAPAPTSSATPAPGAPNTDPPANAGPATAGAGQTVLFSNGGSGWLQLPSGAGKHPALLLIPEWWGVDDWIKQDVARFASQGYVALAVDLYRGKVASDPGAAHELMRGLSEDRATDDMKTAFEWLGARPDVDPKRIGNIGWCMGGGYALAFAVAEPRLRAVVVNYGKLVTAPDKIASIHAPLLGNFAGLDRGISPDDVRSFERAMKTAHKDTDIKIYDGAKHAFMNSNNKEAYNESAAKDAWSRIDAFLSRTLGSSG